MLASLQNHILSILKSDKGGKLLEVYFERDQIGDLGTPEATTAQQRTKRWHGHPCKEGAESVKAGQRQGSELALKHKTKGEGSTLQAALTERLVSACDRLRSTLHAPRKRWELGTE